MSLTMNRLKESCRKNAEEAEHVHTKLSDEVSKLRRQVELRKKVVKRDQSNLIALTVGCITTVVFVKFNYGPIVGVFAAVVTKNILSSKNLS